MLQKARTAKQSVHRNDFVLLGKDFKFFPGVEDWFPKINYIGDELGVTIEHFIISSGLKEIIEGSNIHKYFKIVFDIICKMVIVDNLKKKAVNKQKI